MFSKIHYNVDVADGFVGLCRCEDNKRKGIANDQNTEGAQKVVVQATTLPPPHIYVSSQGPALPRAQQGTEVGGGGTGPVPLLSHW